MRPIWLGLLLACLSVTVFADSGGLLSIRSNNPFTQIFGLPLQPSMRSIQPGKWQSEINFQVVNNSEAVDDFGESIVLDGETQISTIMLSYAWSERLEVGVDLPYVSHREGSLDGFIYDWHDMLGITNSNRKNPDDLLLFKYARGGSDLRTIASPTSGIGDIRIFASYQLNDGEQSGMQMYSRLSIKLPTGDDTTLHGSGAMDIAADVSVKRRLFERKTRLDLVGHIGLLVLGDGKVLSDQQRSFVPYGGAGLIWAWSDNFDLLAQVSSQGRYFDSELDELGGTTMQLTVGGRYRWHKSNVELGLGLIEDIVSDVTPDVAFHVELRKGF